MSDQMKKTPLRIHTFAGDLNFERNKRDPASDLHSAVTNKKLLSKIPKKETLPKPTPKRRAIPKIAIPTKKKETNPSHQESKNVPHTITHIPAFHEIKKHTQPNYNGSTSTKSIKVEKKKRAHTNSGYGTTIITDTKSNTFKLLPSIFTSIKSWFKKLATYKKKKKTPTYTVPETTSRKGVIQRATSKTGTIFTADNKTLKERIRRRRSATQETVGDNKTEPSWSPYTEPGYNLLKAPKQDRTSNVIIEYKKQRLAVLPSEKVAPKLEEEEKETVTETAETIPQPSWESEVVPPLEKKVLLETPLSKTKEKEETKHEIVETFPSTDMSETLPVAENSKLPSTDVSETLPVAENSKLPSTDMSETLPVAENSKLPSTLSKLINQSETNTLTITLVIVFVSVIFIVRLIMIGLDSSPTDTLVTTKPLIQDTKLINILLNESELDQLPQLLRTAITSAPTGVVELSIVSADSSSLSASYLFEILGFNASPSLQQSITYVRFVTVDQSDPVLLITFVDKNTVLGGLLDWEETMANDMRSLYPIPVEVNGEFIDETLEGIDIRILRNDDEVILVYGFVSDNTLLIAPNMSDFTQIAQPYFIQ
jgi:hypothetical protein